MEKNIKNANNIAHLHGFINDVRINPAGESGRTAINLNVVTTESYKANKDDEEFQTRRTYHDVAIFTDDKKVIKAYEKLQKDCAENKANRETEGYKPKVHEVSLDGMMVSKDGAIQIVCKADNVKPDVKLGENEVRNSAVLSGNIANVHIYEDKKLAVVGIMHHFRPADSEKEYTTTLDLRINGDRKVGKAAYESLVKGEIKAGDFIRTGGQLHNTRYTKEGETETKYGTALDVTSFNLLKQSKKNAESQAEAKGETKKAASKKAASQKTAPKKAPKQTKKTGLKA